MPTSKIVTEEKNKPSLDEQTFGKLIEAAYVLQEHNREMRLLEESLELHSERLRQQEAESQQAQANNLQTVDEPVSRDSDYTLTLAEIVEAQHQIQIRHLEKDAAMAVVAERIVRITRASGAGIAILDDKTIRYRAGAGSPALPVGSETPLAKAICATCVRTGQVLRTLDVNTEFLFDPDLCRGRGIFSLVAVPVYHNGEIVGALELYFEKLNGFAEQDIHTCQLMAGLVTEAIGRDSESSLKQSMAAERSSMLAAIEKLRPSLIAMAEDRSTEQPAEDVHSHSLLTPSASVCWKCGESQIEHEQFCGKCGAALVGDTDPTSFQSEVAATWYSQPTNLNDQVRGQVRDQATPANGAPPWHASAFAAAPRTPVTWKAQVTALPVPVHPMTSKETMVADSRCKPWLPALASLRFLPLRQGSKPGSNCLHQRPFCRSLLRIRRNKMSLGLQPRRLVISSKASPRRDRRASSGDSGTRVVDIFILQLP